MTTAGEMAPVNTSMSTLSVFVGIHTSMLKYVQKSGVLSPRHVMHPAEGRAWIPMNTNFKYAVDWTIWSCEEMSMTVNHPKNELTSQPVVHEDAPARAHALHIRGNVLPRGIARTIWG